MRAKASQRWRKARARACGVVAGSWSTTAEQDLLAEFAQEVSFSLVGSFGPGIFEGTIAEVLGVSAALGG